MGAAGGADAAASDSAASDSSSDWISSSCRWSASCGGALSGRPRGALSDERAASAAVDSPSAQLGVLEAESCGGSSGPASWASFGGGAVAWASGAGRTEAGACCADGGDGLAAWTGGSASCALTGNVRGGGLGAVASCASMAA